jgi:hypothetical protein
VPLIVAGSVPGKAGGAVLRRSGLSGSRLLERSPMRLYSLIVGTGEQDRVGTGFGAQA